jgi:hypothetical protein
MAPVTRSKAGNNPPVPSAPITKGAGGKAKKPKAPTRPSASPAAATSKVQKKGSPKKRKGKARKTSSSEKSEKSSASAASKKTSYRASSKSSAKSSTKASPTKGKTNKTPQPAANESAQDDFPELAQAYGIMPFLDQPTSRPRTPRLASNHALRPDARGQPASVECQPSGNQCCSRLWRLPSSRFRACRVASSIV